MSKQAAALNLPNDEQDYAKLKVTNTLTYNDGDVEITCVIYETDEFIITIRQRWGGKSEIRSVESGIGADAMLSFGRCVLTELSGFTEVQDDERVFAEFEKLGVV